MLLHTRADPERRRSVEVLLCSRHQHWSRRSKSQPWPSKQTDLCIHWMVLALTRAWRHAQPWWRQAGRIRLRRGSVWRTCYCADWHSRRGRGGFEHIRPTLLPLHNARPCFPTCRCCLLLKYRQQCNSIFNISYLFFHLNSYQGFAEDQTQE